MKKYLIIFLFIISCSSQKNLSENNLKSEKYSGGRFGYSNVSLELFSNNSYKYSSFMDSGVSLTDTGYLTFNKGKFYLNSNKTIQKLNGKIISKNKKFKKQEIYFSADTIRLIPNKQSEIDFYKDYFTLIKEKNGCNENKVIDIGGSFNFTEYMFGCPSYQFSENGDKSSKWNVLNPNYIGKVSEEIFPIKEKIEKEIREYAGKKFFQYIKFLSVSINYPDSIAKFKGVSGIKFKKCNAKYFFYYYYKPKTNVKYCIGIPVNIDGKRLSKFNFPSKNNFKIPADKLNVCQVIRIAKIYEKNIEPIKKISFEYDKEKKEFYWLITQKSKVIKRKNGYFEMYNIVKIDASDGSLISKHNIKGRVLINERFF